MCFIFLASLLEKKQVYMRRMGERPAHSKLNKQADATLQLSETV